MKCSSCGREFDKTAQVAKSFGKGAAKGAAAGGAITGGAILTAAAIFAIPFTGGLSAAALASTALGAGTVGVLGGAAKAYIDDVECPHCGHWQ